jgi:hypothetical protein
MMSHTHEGAHGLHRQHSPVQAERWAAVLDVGEDVGALLLYTPAELVGCEIEVSPLGRPHQRTHTEVLRRSVGGKEVYAALYAALAAGVYRIWHDDRSRERRVTVVGGEVAQVDWR